MAGEEYPKMYLYKRVVQAKLFIDNHYSDRLDLDNIADEARFSKFHFIRLFKSIYGKTPHHYLTQVRMEKAKEFLSNQMSVADTCTSVGFDSPTSFTALFKKKFGQSPSGFQQQQHQRNTDISLFPLRFVPNCFAEHYGWSKKSNF